MVRATVSFVKDSIRCAAALAALLAAGCGGPAAGPAAEPAKLTVAAAANLTGVMDEMGAAFTKRAGTQVAISYGSTAQLAQQIANGAPFDVFAAADVEHVDGLVEKRAVLPGSRAVYARGQLALWMPKGEETGVRELRDLAKASVRFVAVAQPELAPYGAAAVEAMQAAKAWEAVKAKVVYANNISMAKQYGATGNADAAFTAYSLVLREKGTVLKVNPALYKPIEQGLGVVAASKRPEEAKQFAGFVLGAEGKAILARNGYLVR